MYGVCLVKCYGSRAVHKNHFVSGRPAGWLKKVRLEFFFSSFFFFFSPKMDNIFMEKKKWTK